MSSDDEDEFDKFLTKKLNIIKKKNLSTTNYYFYLVSRNSIINIFRNSKNKDWNIISFIFLIILSCVCFGILTMLDFSKI